MDALDQSIRNRCSRISDRLDRLIEADAADRAGDDELALEGAQVERMAAEHAVVERPRPFSFDERAKDHVSPLQSLLR